jgi:hypothetical protein
MISLVVPESEPLEQLRVRIRRAAHALAADPDKALVIERAADGWAAVRLSPVIEDLHRAALDLRRAIADQLNEGSINAEV